MKLTIHYHSAEGQGSWGIYTQTLTYYFWGATTRTLIFWHMWPSSQAEKAGSNGQRRPSNKQMQNWEVRSQIANKLEKKDVGYCLYLYSQCLSYNINIIVQKCQSNTTFLIRYSCILARGNIYLSILKMR